MLQTRPEMGGKREKVVLIHQTEEGKAREAHGGIAVLLEFADWLGWNIDEKFIIH